MQNMLTKNIKLKSSMECSTLRKVLAFAGHLCQRKLKCQNCFPSFPSIEVFFFCAKKLTEKRSKWHGESQRPKFQINGKYEKRSCPKMFLYKRINREAIEITQRITEGKISDKRKYEKRSSSAQTSLLNKFPENVANEVFEPKWRNSWNSSKFNEYVQKRKGRVGEPRAALSFVSQVCFQKVSNRFSNHLLRKPTPSLKPHTATTCVCFPPTIGGTESMSDTRLVLGSASQKGDSGPSMKQPRSKLAAELQSPLSLSLSLSLRSMHCCNM